MKALLIVQQGPGAGSSYALDPQKQSLFSMGRSAACDIVVRDHRASRHHCDIRWNGHHWELLDQGSTNGTFVNGVQVRQSKELFPGDAIAIGESTLVVQQQAGPGPSLAPGSAPTRPRPLTPVPIDAPLPAPAAFRGELGAGQRTSTGVQIAFWFVQGLIAVAVVCLAAGALLPWFRITGSLSSSMESLIRGIADIASSFIGEDLLSVTQDVNAVSGFGRLALGLAVLGAVMLIADIFLRREWIVSALVYILPSAAVSAVIASDVKSLYDVYEQVQSMSLLFGIDLADVVEAFGSFIEVEVTLLPGLYLTMAGLGLIFVGGIARLVVALLARNK